MNFGLLSVRGGLASVVAVGTLVEAVLGSGDLGIDALDLLCSAEIIANCSGLCGSI